MFSGYLVLFFFLFCFPPRGVKNNTQERATSFLFIGSPRGHPVLGSQFSALTVVSRRLRHSFVGSYTPRSPADRARPLCRLWCKPFRSQSAGWTAAERASHAHHRSVAASCRAPADAHCSSAPVAGRPADRRCWAPSAPAARSAS